MSLIQQDLGEQNNESFPVVLSSCRKMTKNENFNNKIQKKVI